MNALCPCINQLTGRIGLAVQYAYDSISTQLTGVGNQYQSICAGLFEPACVDIDNVQKNYYFVECLRQFRNVSQLVLAQLIVVLDDTVCALTCVTANGVECGIRLRSQLSQLIICVQLCQCAVSSARWESPMPRPVVSFGLASSSPFR